MNLNDREFKEVLAALDRSLRHFSSRPAETGFDQELYDELHRVRQTLLRARRDWRDPNLRQSVDPIP